MGVRVIEHGKKTFAVGFSVFYVGFHLVNHHYVSELESSTDSSIYCLKKMFQNKSPAKSVAAVPAKKGITIIRMLERKMRFFIVMADI